MKRDFFTLFLLIALASCVDKKPLSKENVKFAGYWTSDNGSFVNILADGSGECLRLTKEGNMSSKTSLNSAAVFIKNDTILFTVLGIKEYYHIDKAPAPGADNTIVLDKVTYTKE
jgi:hypothetical protein